MIHELAVTAIVGIFTVLWWLLRQKDSRQQEEIKEMKEKQLNDLKEVKTAYQHEIQEFKDKTKGEVSLLWEKHDEDANRLKELELEIAKRHYLKDELDTKFDRLDYSIRERLDELGSKFDKLSDILIHRGVAGQ